MAHRLRDASVGEARRSVLSDATQTPASATIAAAAPDLYAVVEKLLAAFHNGIRSMEDDEEEELYDMAISAFEKAGG